LRRFSKLGIGFQDLLRSVDFQTCRGILFECRNCFRVITQQAFNDCGALIAASQPDYFGWSAQQGGQFGKIGVEGNKCETVR
jgi:hypothetical protein